MAGTGHIRGAGRRTGVRLWRVLAGLVVGVGRVHAGGPPGPPPVYYAETYVDPDPHWYDWQLRWERLEVDSGIDLLRFADWETMNACFGYYLPRESVLLQWEGAWGTWDIPRFDMIVAVGELLRLQREDQRHSVHYVYLDRDQDLVQVQFEYNGIDAVFRRDDEGWYRLCYSSRFRGPPKWLPQCIVLTADDGDRFLLMPDCDTGTGGGFISAGLRLIALNGEAVQLIAEACVRSGMRIWQWSDLRSTFAWFPEQKVLRVRQVHSRGVDDRPLADRVVSELYFDLGRRSRSEMELANGQFEWQEQDIRRLYRPPDYPVAVERGPLPSLPPGESLPAPRGQRGTEESDAPALNYWAGRPEPMYRGPLSDVRTEERYVTQPGDTWQSVAEQFGVTPEALARQNGWDDKLIVLQPYREVFIPPPLPSPEVKSSDPSAESADPPAVWIDYAVQPEDTLSDIGMLFIVPPEAIAEANDLAPGEALEPGTVLHIPPSSSVP